MKSLAHALVISLVTAPLLCACATLESSAHGSAGTLLIVGGGLDNDSRPIYERFVVLASRHMPPNILIATAATGPEEDEVVDKTEALRIWAPDALVRAIRRDTPPDECVQAIEGATAILFTGGDQARITARYRPEGHETPESLAMRRLLARGGVIAGCSAGDAMMGEVMLLRGGSGTALGIAPKDVEDDNQPVLGARVGPGMGFLTWCITDSHFFERDRVGRLVAALEASGTRLGLGVSEDGCVEVDIATGEVRGVGVSESLLVDVGHLTRDGLVRRSLLARVIAQGDRVSLRDRLVTPRPPVPPCPAGAVHDVPIVEPGQNRQLASWRIFRRAVLSDETAARITFDDWRLTAWSAGEGEVAFEVGPR